MFEFAAFLITTILACSALAAPPLAGAVDTQTCSGAVVRFKGQSAQSPALVLTNGHCIHLMAAGEVVEHAVSARALILFDGAGKPVAHGFRPKEILYATMTEVDLALYQLAESFEELESLWQIPHRFLSEQGFEALDPAPLLLASGRFRKNLPCKPVGVTNVREGVWSWTGSLRLDDCRIENGMSGSPLISSSTGEIVALVNTFHAGTGSACSRDNPCENAPDGTIRTYPGRAYASPVALLSGCLDSARNFDTQAPGCRLRSKTRR